MPFQQLEVNDVTEEASSGLHCHANTPLRRAHRIGPACIALILAWALSVSFASTSRAGEDSDYRDEYEARIAQLRIDADFTEAAELTVELLALMRSDSALTRFDIEATERNIDLLRFVAGLAPDQQQELALADSLAAVVEECYHEGRPAQAASASAAQLEILRRHLGNEHIEVAKSLSALALFTAFTGDLETAAPLFRQSLSLMRKIHKAEHPILAQELNNYGALLMHQGDYVGAELFFQKALLMDRTLLGNVNEHAALTLGNMGILRRDQGDYLGAEPLFQEALAITRELFGDEHKNTARCIGNLGCLQKSRKIYSEAEPLFRESLALNIKLNGESHPATTNVLNNLGTVLHELGQYDEAEEIYRKVLSHQLARYKGDHSTIALSYLNIGSVLRDKRKLEDARFITDKALGAYIRLLGYNHHRVIGAKKAMARILRLEGNWAEAEEQLSEATHIYNMIRTRAGSGVERATFITSPYTLLPSVRLRLGLRAEAWEAVESSHARVLSDILLSAETRRLSGVEEAKEDSLGLILKRAEEELAVFQRSARSDTSAIASARVEEARDQLLSAQTDWASHQELLAERYPATEGQGFALERIQACLEDDMALIGWVDVRLEEDVRTGKAEHDSWIYVIRSEGPVAWEATAMADPASSRGSPYPMLRDYRRILTSPKTSLLGYGREAHQIWAQRIGPVSQLLRGVKHLVVIPSGAMHGVPIESLRNDLDQPLGAAMMVSYAPSATIRTWLIERSSHREYQAEESALFLGDPPFNAAQRPPHPFPGPRRHLHRYR